MPCVQPPAADETSLPALCICCSRWSRAPSPRPVTSVAKRATSPARAPPGARAVISAARSGTSAPSARTPTRCAPYSCSDYRGLRGPTAAASLSLHLLSVVLWPSARTAVAPLVPALHPTRPETRMLRRCRLVSLTLHLHLTRSHSLCASHAPPLPSRLAHSASASHAVSLTLHLCIAALQRRRVPLLRRDGPHEA